MKKEIKILHSSCCKTGSPIKSQIESIGTAHQLDLQIEEFSELADTMVYGTMIFPSIVVDKKVYDYKKYNTTDKLLSIIQ